MNKPMYGPNSPIPTKSIKDKDKNKKKRKEVFFYFLEGFLKIFLLYLKYQYLI